MSVKSCQYCPYAAYSSSNIDRHVVSVHFKKDRGQDEEIAIVRETSPAISKMRSTSILRGSANIQHEQEIGKMANRKRKLSDYGRRGEPFPRKKGSESGSEKAEMYRKLSSWMEESQRQLAKVIGPLDGGDDAESTEGLVEEVCDLKARLSSMTRERNRLFATVKKLSDEIGTLR